MITVFKNPDDNRLRAGWRILFFLLLFLSGSSLIFVTQSLMGVSSKRAFLNDYSLLIITILAITATASVYLIRRFVDKRSFTSLGLQLSKKTWKDLAFGFVLSLAMAGAFTLGLYSLGVLQFEGVAWQSLGDVPFHEGFVPIMGSMSVVTVALLLLETLLVGYWEELVFRGYVFQNMTEGIGLKLAIIVSCLLYGLIHAANPNATTLSSLIIVAFGFLRIYGYLATGQLWLSMGMHIGWNFFQGPIFGFAASGHEKSTLLQHSTEGANWLTGGSFGPEGSLLILPILLFALVAMYKWAQRDVEEPTLVGAEAQ